MSQIPAAASGATRIHSLSARFCVRPVPTLNRGYARCEMSTRDRLTNLYESFLKKRPRQSRSRSVVDAILRAALERLARTGDEESLKVDDVAARAGVGIGSLYDYFPNRERLLVGLATKVAEEKLVGFEEVLIRVRSMPLRSAISTIVDFAFEEYLGNPPLTRIWVRVATANHLLPVLARSQDALAEKLAADLAQREDVNVSDVDAAAWLLTNALMGIINTSLWEDEQPLERARVRDGFIEMAHAFLAKNATR